MREREKVDVRKGGRELRKKGREMERPRGRKRGDIHRRE